MLYVTTRNNTDIFTAQKVLAEKSGPDGGLFVPFHMPQFTMDNIQKMAEGSFNQCVSQILNILFGTKLTAWDLDFAIGRYPVRTKLLGQRMVLEECWHNPEWNFDRQLHQIYQLICNKTEDLPSDWVEIGIRIACYFAMYAELIRRGIARLGEKIDISCISGTFSSPISAWYARQWGLPIENIICCCNENSEIWNLLCNGQLKTDIVSETTVLPEMDIAIPTGVERLVHACGGIAEVSRLQEARQQGKSYFPADSTLAQMRQGLFVSVVSSRRVITTIPSVYATHGYLMSPYSALVYAGLQDYRSKKKEVRCSLLILDKSPVCDGAVVAAAMGITMDDLKKYMD